MTNDLNWDEQLEHKELNEETLFTVSQIFKALSDPTRIRILYLLLKKECSVNEIAELLSLSQSNVSHQLRLLQNVRLVKYKREGTSHIFSPDDTHVMSILAQAIYHVEHD